LAEPGFEPGTVRSEVDRANHYFMAAFEALYDRHFLLLVANEGPETHRGLNILTVDQGVMSGILTGFRLVFDGILMP